MGLSRNTQIALGVGAAAGLLWLVSSPTYSYGGPQKGELNRSPELLLPSFAAKLNVLFARMRALGWDPILNEGWRDPARAAQLATTGAGIADSMHSYGAAADIKSISSNWSNPAFFTALGAIAEELGMTWGGRFSRSDATHVQAVTVRNQDMLATLYRSSPAAADALAAQDMAKMAALARVA